MPIKESIDIRAVPIASVKGFIESWHAYKSCSNTATYCFAVFEGAEVVAAYLWQPPPVGAAKSACPEEPGAVLALSRMVATPKDKRKLRHISKPLKRIMAGMIDRGRWPVLITYSDESQGHTGHVYKCSGWQKTLRIANRGIINATGQRVSRYSNGKHVKITGARCVTYVTQRWEQWACPREQVKAFMESKGWKRVQDGNKTWKSGNPAYRFVKDVT